MLYKLKKTAIMKKITSLLLIIAISFVANAQVTNYNVGDVVDDFTVTDIHGDVHNLYDITASGKHVYLDFFFDTCGPCQVTTPIFNEFHDKYGCNEGEIYCISMNNGSDSNAEVEAFENAYGGPFNHAPAISADGGAGAVDAAFGIGAYPTYCLIGPDNKLIENDIWVNNTVTLVDFENAFPAGFDPAPMECFLGTLDAINTSDFMLYPTVSDGNNINLRLSNQITSVTVVVYDVLGKVVLTNEYNSSSIVLNLNVNSGNYFVKTITETGSTVKKLIIK